jgi:hypothetical protein
MWLKMVDKSSVAVAPWVHHVYVLSCALQLWILSPCRDRIWCCHVPYSFGHHLPVKVGSGAVTYPTALDLNLLLMWALTLSRNLWLRTSSSDWGRLLHCHVSYDSKPHLSAEVGSGAVACSIASDHASQPGRVPVLLRVPRFLMDRGSQIYKESLSWPNYVARPVCF